MPVGAPSHLTTSSNVLGLFGSFTDCRRLFPLLVLTGSISVLSDGCQKVHLLRFPGFFSQVLGNPLVPPYGSVKRRIMGITGVQHVIVDLHVHWPLCLSPSEGAEAACRDWLCWAWDFHAWAPALFGITADESHSSFCMIDCQRSHHMRFLTTSRPPRWSKIYLFIYYSCHNLGFLSKRSLVPIHQLAGGLSVWIFQTWHAC